MPHPRRLWAAAAAGALQLAVASTPAAAEPTQPACRIGPFANPSIAEQVSYVRRDCRDDALQWRIDPRPQRATEGTPGPLRAEIEQIWTTRPAEALRGSVKLGWSGSHQLGDTGPSTDRAVMAASSTLQLANRWWLQMNVGREVSALAARSRTTVASVWQPIRSSALFAEWGSSAGEPASRRAGARWWASPRRLAIDLAARHEPGGIGWVDPRIGITYSVAR